jgi:hypothetical protein
MMKKKFFAVALATTMTVSTVMTASAETVNAIDITNAFSANTGDESVTGDFDVTYTFHNATMDTSANWNNFILEIFDGAGEFVTLRADAFGWTAGSWTLGGDTVENAGKNPLWTGQPEDWTAWAAVMTDADVTVNVKRTGNVLDVQYDMKDASNAYQFNTVVTVNEDLPETLNMHLTGEKVSLKDIKFTDNTKKGEDVSTDDTKKDDTTKETTTKKEESTTKKEESTTAATSVKTEATATDAAKAGATVTGTNVPTGATVTVNTVTDKDTLAKVDKAVKDTLSSKVGKYAVLDITMLDAAGAKIQPLNNGNVLVTIDVPSTLDANKGLVVYRMEDNGTLTELKTSVENGKVSFETNHFSTYIVAEKAAVAEETTTAAAAKETTTAKTNSPKTGDAAPVAALMVVALGACGAVIASKKKNA